MKNKYYNLLNLYFLNKKETDWMVIRSEVILSELYPKSFQMFKALVKANRDCELRLTYKTTGYFITFYISGSDVDLPILISFVPDFFDYPMRTLKYAAAVFYGFGAKYGSIFILTQAFTEDYFLELATKIFTHYGLEISPDYRKELLYYESNK